mgnify:CR=1 FL=1
MKEPAVTILVTVRNAENTIEKCIRSLLNIGYSNYKIYVSDAYSDDRTWEILQKFRKKIKIDDSVHLNFSGKISKHIQFEKGKKCIVVSGTYIGKRGKIQEIDGKKVKLDLEGDKTIALEKQRIVVL